MRTEACFTGQTNGYWVGKTRAGAPVKIKATEETTAAIERSFANVVVIEISKEAVELAKASQTP